MAEIISSDGNFDTLVVIAMCSVCGNMFNWSRLISNCPECGTDYKVGIIVSKVTRRGEKRGPKEKYKIKWIYTRMRSGELDCC